MASIFFNFGSVGNNDTVYFFVNVSFGSPISLSLEDQEIFNYKIYPNPTSDIIKILGNTSVLNVIIYDVLGKEILRKSVIDKIDISSFKNGTYFIIISDGIINSSYKIIKN